MEHVGPVGEAIENGSDAQHEWVVGAEYEEGRLGKIVRLDALAVEEESQPQTEERIGYQCQTVNLQVVWGMVEHVCNAVGQAKEDKEANDVKLALVEQVHGVDVKHWEHSTKTEHGEALPRE